MLELNEFAVSYEGTDATRIFMEPVFMDKSVMDEFRVMPNVVTRKKLQFASKLEKILQRHVNCVRTPKGTFGLYDREIEVDRIRFDLEFCWEDFKDTIVEELLAKGQRIADLSAGDPVIQQMIITRVQEAVNKDINRLYYFGDKDGGDADYDLVDGFWTVHAPQIVADNLAPYFNTGSGVALTAGQGISRIKTVYDNMSDALSAMPGKEILVSETVYNQYVEDIEDGGGGDYGLLQMINGVQNPTFRGLPVVKKREWNRYYDDDLGNTLTHFILITTKQNNVVATDLVTDTAKVDMWYEKKDEKIYVRGAFKLGCNYVHPSLFSIGY